MQKISSFVFSIILVFSFGACDDNVLDDSDGYDSEYGEEFLSLGDGGAGISGSGNGDSTQISIEAGQITAGEWNDLANWDFWIQLMEAQDSLNFAEYWGYDLSTRVKVHVQDGGGKPVVDESVQLLGADDVVLAEGRTGLDGIVELWPSLSNKYTALSNIRMKAGGHVLRNAIVAYENGLNEITISGDYDNSNYSNLEIAFVVDATGSMSDELEYLKVELIDVIDSVKEVNPEANIMTSAVFYRDETDEYLTRKSDFTSSIANTISFIKKQEAAGGGDFPEAVHSALHVAINQLQWSNKSTSRLLFLILDAPPHYDEQILEDLQSNVLKASRLGIHIVPVVASGIDKETEFLMRFMSILTNGTYVFITNDSGIGGEHLEPTVGEYNVEYLNDLMVRLINSYL